MSIKTYEVHWTPQRAAEFIDLAALQNEDAAIIQLRPRRYGRVKDCFELERMGFPMSLDSYDVHIRQLKALYDAVQPCAELLPPRQRCKADAIRLAGWHR